MLGAGTALLVQVSEALHEGRDQLRLFRVERQTEEIYAGPAVDASQLLPQVVSGVKPRPEVSQTFPAAFWQQTASLAKKAPGPVVVLLLTDGDNDDQTPEAKRAIKAAASALAACPNTRSVVVAGVSRQNRAWLREALEPALGGRLQLLAPEQMSVDTVRPALLGR